MHRVAPPHRRWRVDPRLPRAYGRIQRTENKERYYETLQLASVGWHEGNDDPWRYVAFLLSTCTLGYRQFEQRLSRTAEPKGAKTDAIEHAIAKFRGDFTVGELERVCPGVSVDMVRHVLKKLRSDGVVECLSRGAGAKWRAIRSEGPIG